MNRRTRVALALLLAAVLSHEASAQKRPSPQTGDNRTIVLYRVRTLARSVSDLRVASESTAQGTPDGTIRDIRSALTSLKSEVKKTGMDERTVADFITTVTATQRALDAFVRAHDETAKTRAVDEIARNVEQMGRMAAGPG